MSLFTFNIYDSEFNKKELREIKKILINNNLKLNQIMAEQTQLAADLAVVTEQVAKIGAEVSATLKKVEELEAALDAADDVTPEVQAAFDALKVQVQAVDDLVPDAA